MTDTLTKTPTSDLMAGLPEAARKKLAAMSPAQRAAFFEKLKQRKAEAAGAAGAAGAPGARERAASAATAPIPIVSREDYSYLLSFAQQRLWFLDRFEPDSPEYNLPQAYLIEGVLDREMLARAVNAVVARHETLRTWFVDQEGVPYQRIAEELTVPLPYEDLTRTRDGGRRSDEEAWREAMDRLGVDAKVPFDLAAGPLIRALLFRVGEEKHLFYLNVHHISSDGWSMGAFARELGILYRAFAEGRGAPGWGTAELEAELPELPIQYLDFGLWQRDWLSGEVLERQIDYWRGRLAGAAPLDLPTDFPRPPTRTFNGDAAPMHLSGEEVAAAKELARQEGATLFMVLAAAFKALLSHYTAQDDVTLGTLIANRRRPEVENLIGFFANTLVLRTNLAGDPTFREILAREREASLDAHTYQDLPFEKLVDELKPPRDMARTPLFQSMLILLNAPGEPLALPGATLRPVPIDSRTSKMEMTLYAVEQRPEDGGGLTSYLEYNTDLFTRETIERFLGHFRVLLEAVLTEPDLRHSQVPLLTAAERAQLLGPWNETSVSRPDVSLPELLAETFAVQKTERPSHPAVESGGVSLTYRQLDEASNRLARHLIALGVGPEVRVGVSLARGTGLLVGLLGVLKAGGAYVPLDTEYPADRLAYMAEDAEIAVLLAEEATSRELPPALVQGGGQGAPRVVLLDRETESIAARSGEPLPPRALPASLAYILYTSGSTGRPKGVQVEHRSLVNFLLAMRRRPGLGPDDRLLAVTTLAFDIAGLELYLPLLAGGTVVLATGEESGAGERLVEILERGSEGGAITAMQATPATWRLLLGAGWTGAGWTGAGREGAEPLKVLCGGEALPRDLAEQLVEAVGTVWNVYGPTEATIWATVERIDGERLGEAGPVAIGLPVENLRAHVVTPHGTLAPVGVAGELMLGGAGLARGYRGRPDLTAAAFVPDPFGAEMGTAATQGGRPAEAGFGARLYRTGDLARRLPDGRLQCLGRLDFQVKIRGFRIELGEIEAALDSHPDIRQGVALAREDRPGHRRLVGYYVPEGTSEGTAEGAEAGERDPHELDAGDLKAYLAERIPEYMVPALFVALPSFPLTPNGKVDRRALPAPDASAAAAEYLAPRNSKEETMADIWAEVLKMDRVGVLDDFFDLGGDSLLVIQVVTKAGKAGIPITTKQVFQHRTIADLTAAAGTCELIAEQGPVSGWVPLTPAQLHFMELEHPNPGFHSLGALFEARKLEGGEGYFVPRAMAKAMETVALHHDTLRSRMVRIDPSEGEEAVLEKTGPGRVDGRPGEWALFTEEPPGPLDGADPWEVDGRHAALFYLDLSALDEDDKIPVLSRNVRAFVTDYDLEAGPLFKGLLLGLEPGRAKHVFFSAHFYPADLGSWRPLQDDLDTAYRQHAAGEEVELQPKTTSARDWALRLAERADLTSGGEHVMPEEEVRYWLEQAPENPVRFPMDHQRGKNDWPSAKLVKIQLDEADTEILLSHAPRAFGVQIDGILVTAIISAFSTWTGERSLPILLLGHGREALFDDMDITRTVGWFNTIYPANIDLGPAPAPGREEDWAAVARRVNRQLREVPNGGIGYGLLRYLSGDPEISERLRRAPAPQVFFNYVGPTSVKEMQAFKWVENFGGYTLDNDTSRLCPITLGGYINNDALLMKWEYSENLHRTETIEGLARHCESVMRWFVDTYRRRHGGT